ncbi:MAG: hypothetical protein FJZ96_00085 [Chloroflexi bacterium]|nr:hypothetical protein [Chloroflexota bacterium]
MATIHNSLPEAGRVSVLTASILLSFALTRVIDAPPRPLDFNLAGVTLSVNANLNTALAIIAAGLAASGMNWLLRNRPEAAGARRYEYLLLPTLTALVIGIALYSLPATAVWWVGFGAGGLILAAVFLAEYIAVDPADARYAPASAALTALSFAIYLVLAAALEAMGARLYLLVPAIFLAGGLASLRTLHLRLQGRWEAGWAAGIGLAGTQLAAALHYWPLTPVQFGLALLGPVYALTALAANLKEQVPLRRALVEPLAMLGLIWGLFIWFR